MIFNLELGRDRVVTVGSVVAANYTERLPRRAVIVRYVEGLVLYLKRRGLAVDTCRSVVTVGSVVAANYTERLPRRAVIVRYVEGLVLYLKRRGLAVDTCRSVVTVGSVVANNSANFFPEITVKGYVELCSFDFKARCFAVDTVIAANNTKCLPRHAVVVRNVEDLVFYLERWRNAIVTVFSVLTVFTVRSVVSNNLGESCPACTVVVGDVEDIAFYLKLRGFAVLTVDTGCAPDITQLGPCCSFVVGNKQNAIFYLERRRIALFARSATFTRKGREPLVKRTIEAVFHRELIGGETVFAIFAIFARCRFACRKREEHCHYEQYCQKFCFHFLFPFLFVFFMICNISSTNISRIFFKSTP